jgi:hypothetical protein
MSPRRILSAATAAAVLAGATTAAAAEAPVVSAQHTLHGTAPVTVPGTGVQRGEWLGSRARLVYRDVSFTDGGRTRVTLRAPAGKRIRGVVPSGGTDVSFVVTDRSYVGKRQVTLRAVSRVRDGEAEARIYALAR